MSVTVKLGCNGCHKYSKWVRVASITEARRRIAETHAWTSSKGGDGGKDFCPECQTAAARCQSWDAFVEILSVDAAGTRVVNVLTMMGRVSTELLRQTPELELMDVRGLGKSGVLRVRAALKALDDAKAREEAENA